MKLALGSSSVRFKVGQVGIIRCPALSMISMVDLFEVTVIVVVWRLTNDKVKSPDIVLIYVTLYYVFHVFFFIFWPGRFVHKTNCFLSIPAWNIRHINNLTSDSDTTLMKPKPLY